MAPCAALYRMHSESLSMREMQILKTVILTGVNSISHHSLCGHVELSDLKEKKQTTSVARFGWIPTLMAQSIVTALCIHTGTIIIRHHTARDGAACGTYVWGEQKCIEGLHSGTHEGNR
jgi:hypothetical protein